MFQVNTCLLNSSELSRPKSILSGRDHTTVKTVHKPFTAQGPTLPSVTRSSLFTPPPCPSKPPSHQGPQRFSHLNTLRILRISNQWAQRAGVNVAMNDHLTRKSARCASSASGRSFTLMRMGDHTGCNIVTRHPLASSARQQMSTVRKGPARC